MNENINVSFIRGFIYILFIEETETKKILNCN